MTSPNLVTSHIGIVVRNIEEAAARYESILGLDRWRRQDMGPMILAYGGTPGIGMAFELIQPKTPDHGVAADMIDFLEMHGEGVHHVGFWTFDVRGALQKAVSGGGTLLDLNFRLDSETVVQVQMPPQATNPYFNVGFAGDGATPVRWEFLGPPADEGLRQWLADEFPELVPPPPWA